MPTTFELPLRMPTLPPGFCATLGQNWPQQILNEVAKGAALLTSETGRPVVVSDTAPDNTLRDLVLWRRPADGRIYEWSSSGGVWVLPHPYPANSAVRILWIGTPSDLWSFDGGDGTDPVINPPALNTGAMWDVDPAFAGYSPMGVGTIPGMAVPKSLSAIEKYGAGEVTLTVEQLAPHVHGSASTDNNFASWAGTGNTQGHTVNAGESGTNGVIDTQTNTGQTGGSGTPPAAQPVNIVHPVYGVYFALRTNRSNYTAS